jgi:hypothetical protein
MGMLHFISEQAFYHIREPYQQIGKNNEVLGVIVLF